MKLTCASCGAIASLDVMLSNESAREALLLAFKMPAPLGRLLVQYLGLFRPESRNLSFDRVAKLLGELQPLIDAGQFDRNHHTWAAPVDIWVAGIEAVLSKRHTIDLPLKSHGYLLEVMAGMCNRVEAQAESKKEEAIKARGNAPRNKPPIEPVVKVAPAEFREALQNFTGRSRMSTDDAGDMEARRQSTLRALAEAERIKTGE
jgi:hypothetical protein